MTRRDILKSSAIAFGGKNLMALVNKDTNDKSGRDAILQRIKAPVFPKRDFDVTKSGAKGDGQTKCTDAIRQAIHACSAAGGGRVVIPAGKFLTGAIHLENNVNLYISEGATLLFSQETRDYLPAVFTRYEGTECMNYSPFIYAFEKTNIGITGPGTLDGQAGPEHWWPWTGRQRNGWKPGDPNMQKDRSAILHMGDTDVPVEKREFGEGHYLRPNFVQPYRCTNVVLDGFRIINSPMWELNPVLCRNVTVSNIRIDSHGPNNDGCDPESCTDVLITGCTFSTGDDCIAIKSGRNRDGRRVGAPCQNVLVENCEMKDGHGGVSIGSEVSGGLLNVYVRNCHMSSPHLERALRIKTNSYRGGEIRNINFEDVQVGQVAEATIEVDFYYEEGEGGPFKPVVRDIHVANVRCEKSKHAVFLRGFADDPISGITIANCTFNNASEGVLFKDVESVKLQNVLVNGKPLTTADIKQTKS